MPKANNTESKEQRQKRLHAERMKRYYHNTDRKKVGVWLTLELQEKLDQIRQPDESDNHVLQRLIKDASP